MTNRSRWQMTCERWRQVTERAHVASHAQRPAGARSLALAPSWTTHVARRSPCSLHALNKGPTHTEKHYIMQYTQTNVTFEHFYELLAPSAT